MTLIIHVSTDRFACTMDARVGFTGGEFSIAVFPGVRFITETFVHVQFIRACTMNTRITETFININVTVGTWKDKIKSYEKKKKLFIFFINVCRDNFSGVKKTEKLGKKKPQDLYRINMNIQGVFKTYQD